MKSPQSKLLHGIAGLWLATSCLFAQEPLPTGAGQDEMPPEDALPGAAAVTPDVSPEQIAPEVPEEVALPSEHDPVAAQADADANYLRQFSLTNASTRTALHSATGNADRFFQGFSGVPHPSFSDLLPLNRPAVFEMKVGPLKVRPSVGTGLSVTSFRGNDSRTETEAYTSLGLAAELGEPLDGRFLSGNYAVSYLFGTNRRRPSDLDQTFSLLGEYDFEKLKLGTAVSYTSYSGADREFTRGTQRQLLTASFTASYQWTENTIFDLDVTVPVSQFSDGIGTGGVTLTGFANYTVTPKTLVGLGVSTGYIKVDQGATQSFEQVLLRVLSNASPFISYYATAGVDFHDLGERNVTHPVFALGSGWTPREGTSVSLAAEQRVQNSAQVSNEDFLSTSVILTLAQRVGSNTSLSTTFGFEHAKYQSSLPGVNLSRADDTYFGQVSLTTYVSRHCTVVGTLSYRDTESSTNPQSAEQAGLQITYTF